MDTITQYRQQIKTVLETHARHVWDDRIQAQIIIDTEHDHYQLVYVGWRDSKRCYGVVLHIDIIGSDPKVVKRLKRLQYGNYNHG